MTNWDLIRELTEYPANADVLWGESRTGYTVTQVVRECVLADDIEDQAVVNNHVVHSVRCDSSTGFEIALS